MAMTKKERAEFDAALKAARIMGALRFTAKVLPDVAIPGFGIKPALATGFLFNSHSPRVVPACSSSTSHSFGRNDKTDSQHPRALFSTELFAWSGLRNELEQKYAASLAEVDARIAELEAQSA